MFIREVQIYPSESGFVAKPLIGIWEFKDPVSLIWISFSKSNTGLALVFYQMWLFNLSVSRWSGALWNHPGNITLGQQQRWLKIRLENSGSSSREAWERAGPAPIVISPLNRAGSHGRYFSVGVLQKGTDGFVSKRLGLRRGWESNWFLPWSPVSWKYCCARILADMLGVWGWFHKMEMLTVDIALVWDHLGN